MTREEMSEIIEEFESRLELSTQYTRAVIIDLLLRVDEVTKSDQTQVQELLQILEDNQEFYSLISCNWDVDNEC